MSELGIGVVSSILAVLIVFFVQCIWKGIVEPWYEERIYSDAKIEGVWELTYPELHLKESVTLKRKGHSVTGTIVVTASSDTGKTYELDGRFKNLILTVSYSATDKSALDSGTFTLMLVDNGRRFNGVSSLYVDGQNKIESHKCTWSKKVL
jgi:hypothetical protein